MGRTKPTQRKHKGGKPPKEHMEKTAAHARRVQESAMANLLGQIELNPGEVKEGGAENKSIPRDSYKHVARKGTGGKAPRKQVQGEDKDETANCKSTGKRAIEEIEESNTSASSSSSSSAHQEEIEVEKEESSNKHPVEVAEGKVAEEEEDSGPSDDEDDEEEGEEGDDDHKEKKQAR